MKKVIEKAVVVFVGVISTVYIANPTAGIIELIPDNAPLVGNLDEGGAVTLLLACFRYFGVDITGGLNRLEK